MSFWAIINRKQRIRFHISCFFLLKPFPLVQENKKKKRDRMEEWKKDRVVTLIDSIVMHIDLSSVSSIVNLHAGSHGSFAHCEEEVEEEEEEIFQT